MIHAKVMRPVSTIDLLSCTIDLYRNNFWLFVGIRVAPEVLGLVSGAFAYYFGPDVNVLGVVYWAVFFFLLFVVFVIHIWAEAANVLAVSQALLGSSVTVQDTYRGALRKLSRVLGVAFLVGLGFGLGVMLLVVPGVVVLVRYSVAVPAAVIEDLRVRETLDRSWMLTKGSSGRILLVFLLFLGGRYAIEFGLQAMFVGPGGQLSPWLMMNSFILGLFVGPLSGIAISLVYFDQRVRKEAYNAQVLRAELNRITHQVPASGSPSSGL
jgi:hypothetical protein